MSDANSRQVAGSHYRVHGAELQHWDLVLMYKWDYFQGQIIKYIMRAPYKNGLEDLQKAAHYLEKYIESQHKDDGMAIAGAEPEVAKAESLAAMWQACGEGKQPALMPLTASDQCLIFYSGQVLPTGWVQFVFEGADAQGFLYTCKECGTKFYTTPNHNPHVAHSMCNKHVTSVQLADEAADANASYVSQ